MRITSDTATLSQVLPNRKGQQALMAKLRSVTVGGISWIMSRQVAAPGYSRDWLLLDEEGPSVHPGMCPSHERHCASGLRGVWRSMDVPQWNL